MNVEKDNSFSDAQSPTPRFEFIRGTNIREAYTGREKDYRPWEAPPITSKMVDPEVAAHQDEVEQMFWSLIDTQLPSDLPASTKDLIMRHIFSSDALLDLENQKGYRNRLMLLPELELDDTKLAVHHRVLPALATMQEIHDDMEAIGRSSAELGLLRTLNGLRSEHEVAMLAEVSMVMGDNLKISEPRKLRVTGFDDDFFSDKHMKAMILEYKRDFGTTPNGTVVKSRTSLVVRTDFASGFDQEIRQAIQVSAQHAMQHIPYLTRVRPVLDELVEEGSEHPWVVASMTSLYESNPAIAEQLEQQERDVQKKRLAEGALDSFKAVYIGPEQH